MMEPMDRRRVTITVCCAWADGANSEKARVESVMEAKTNIEAAMGVENEEGGRNL